MPKGPSTQLVGDTIIRSRSGAFCSEICGDLVEGLILAVRALADSAAVLVPENHARLGLGRARPRVEEVFSDRTEHDHLPFLHRVTAARAGLAAELGDEF